MQTTHRQPALTFVMTERQLVNIIRPYMPSQKSINKAEGFLTIGLGMAEVAGGAALLGSPEPMLSKIGGFALTAHGIDMVTAGQRAWRTGTASETQTERLARAAAQKAHAPPPVVNLVGMAADAMLPDGIIHAAAHFGATRALRVASADASRLSFKNDNITPEHFPRPSPQTAQSAKILEKEVLLYPHRQETLDLHHHEAPPHNRKLGGHVLLKHVNPSQAYIDRRFAKEKHDFLSYFTSQTAAERDIHKLLKDNSLTIDRWLTNAAENEKKELIATISGKDTVVVSERTRHHKPAQKIKLIIKKQKLRGMAYHIFTVHLE